MPEPYTVQQVAKLAGDFVVKKRGAWNHEEWQQWCDSIASLGLELDEELRVQLGVLLETLKTCYLSMPKRPKSAAKKKAGAKRKTKAKAKTRAAAKRASSAKPGEGAVPTA